MQIERDGLNDPHASDPMMLAGDGARRTLERMGAASLAAVSARTEFEPFRIDVHREREAVRVAPVGELDLATVAPLGRRLDELRASGCRSVLLDLRRLRFIDSSGVHLILKWDSHARESRIEFAIIQGPAAVRRVFDITGLLDWLPFRAMGAENGTSVRPTSPLGQDAGRSGRMPALPPQRGDADEASAGPCLEGVVG